MNCCGCFCFPDEKCWFCRIILFPLWRLKNYENNAREGKENNVYKTGGRRFETYTWYRFWVYPSLLLVLILLVFIPSMFFHFPLYKLTDFINKYLVINYTETISEIIKILIFLLPLLGMLFINQLNRMEKRVELINEAMRSLVGKYHSSKYSLSLINVSDLRQAMSLIIKEQPEAKDMAEHLLKNSYKIEDANNFAKYIAGNCLAFLSCLLIIGVILLITGKLLQSDGYLGIAINSVKVVFVPLFIVTLITSVWSVIKLMFL